MDWSFRNNWDEFEWEKEIRKDELRIARYFKTLPGCLDLPGEDDMIFRRLMEQPELVPSGVRDPHRISIFDFENNDDEDFSDDGRSRRRGGFEGLRRLENLASEWNLLVASMLDERFFPRALAVTCAFGKLLSRVLNFSDVEESSDTRTLRISLAKRILADINELSLRLEQFKALEALPAHLFARFFEQLTFFRENALDMLQQLRAQRD